MNIQVNVINQKLKIASNIKTLVAGTQEFIRFEFIFDDGWESLMTFAQFRQNGSAYNKYLDENNSVYLPPEITSGECELSLYGSYGNVIAITDSIRMSVSENRVQADSSSTEITLSLYQQLVNMINNGGGNSGSGTGSSVNVDTTLSVPGAAADAAVTGARFNELEAEIGNASNPSDDQIESAIESYLQDNPIQSANVDSSLSVSGAAADAAVTGRRISALESSVSTIIEVSDTEPTTESTELWVDPNGTDLSIPQINDDAVSSEDTWSSQKIQDELDAIKQTGSGGSSEGGSSSGANIDDDSVSSSTTYSSQKIEQELSVLDQAIDDVEALIPTVPSTLPNTHKLVFAGAVIAEYDGSKEVTVTIPQGGDGSGGASVAVDTTLSVSGAAADSAIVGAKIDELNDAINNMSPTGNYALSATDDGAGNVTLSVLSI